MKLAGIALLSAVAFAQTGVRAEQIHRWDQTKFESWWKIGNAPRASGTRVYITDQMQRGWGVFSLGAGKFGLVHIFSGYKTRYLIDSSVQPSTVTILPAPPE